jgi:hypothetical protein
MVAKVREVGGWGRLSVSEQVVHMFDMEIFNVKKLNDAEVREQYEGGGWWVVVVVMIMILTTGLMKVLENIKASSTESLGYCELKQH